MTDRVLPKFSSEAEEAEWWFTQREAVAEEIVKGAKDGVLAGGSLARRKKKARGVEAEGAAEGSRAGTR